MGGGAARLGAALKQPSPRPSPAFSDESFLCRCQATSFGETSCSEVWLAACVIPHKSLYKTCLLKDLQQWQALPYLSPFNFAHWEITALHSVAAFPRCRWRWMALPADERGTRQGPEPVLASGVSRDVQPGGGGDKQHWGSSRRGFGYWCLACRDGFSVPKSSQF